MRQVARLFGALSKKAQMVTTTQKSIITLLDQVHRGGTSDLSSYMFSQDMGPTS